MVACAALYLSPLANAGAEDSRGKNSPPHSPSEAKIAAEQSATPIGSPALAPVDVRSANARSVEVLTSVLGIELGSTVDSAHSKLDKFCAVPPKDEHEPEKDGSEGERKVLWQFAETDYKAVFVKADAEERITSITALLRPGREQAFDNIGDLNKAPMISDSEVAWDVLRPGRPLFRVVARGTKKKAETILIFVVKRREKE